MKAGISAILFDINNTDISDIIIDVMDAKYLAVGSSTINSNMLPPIAAFLCYLKGLAPQGLKTIAFGSYGWGGQSIDLIEAEFEKMKYEKLIPSIKIQYSVKVDQIMKIEEDIKNAFLK
jgi:flavorubredoxin